ncbi:MAG: Fis family transcriptional regulator, partial [Citrobacter sp.]
QDLYYRLNILRLLVPPLRERPQDVALLANALLARQAGVSPSKLQVLQPLMPYLQRHNWPGNIRELENIVERAAVCAEQLQGNDASVSLSVL